MYDQLAVLAPIMLAMTAGTPIFKGRLADIDVRWSTIAQSVDDRTPAERGLLTPEQVKEAADPRMAGQGITPIPKSRYESISTYIYHCKGDTACSRTFAVHNDIPCPIDPAVKARLRASGVDENLAHHIAHLFCRDPISAFVKEKGTSPVAPTLKKKAPLESVNRFFREAFSPHQPWTESEILLTLSFL